MNKPDSGAKRAEDRRQMETWDLKKRIQELEREIEALKRWVFGGENK